MKRFGGGGNRQIMGNGFGPGASKPKVDEFACIGCGNCVRICPFNAIELKGGIAYINSDKCKNCRRCVTICPAGAIS